jgi:hypothetical protein
MSVALVVRLLTRTLILLFACPAVHTLAELSTSISLAPFQFVGYKISLLVVRELALVAATTLMAHTKVAPAKLITPIVSRSLENRSCRHYILISIIVIRFFTFRFV